MTPVNGSPKMMSEIAVKRFQEYLQIKTVQPNPDYNKCKEFLCQYARELDLDFQTIEFVTGKPIIIMTLAGSCKESKSIILNSHTDVVPVSESKWDFNPFGAEIQDGKIYARGSQDMKCVAIWYLEAIRELKMTLKLPLKKTIHLIFVPDEEIGGHDGMEQFVKSKEFLNLNAGFALDEGLACENDSVKVYYGERSPWWIWITATGNAGHGSKFIEPSATIRLLKVLEHFIEFRNAEQKKMETGLKLGQVTSTNITILKSGVQMNVVTEIAEAGVDMRVAPTEDMKELRKRIDSWISSQPGVSFVFKQYFPGAPPTVLDEQNLQWICLQKVAAAHNFNLETEIFPAATDSRYLRQVGLNCIGISPIKSTPVLLHDHNEYLYVQTLLDGISFYSDLIFEIANLP